MKRMRLFLLTIAVVFYIPVLVWIWGTALLLLAFFMPTHNILRNVRCFQPIINKETAYFSVTPRSWASIMDNYTEAFYLSQALIIKKDIDFWECALGGYQYWVNDISPLGNLNRMLSSPESAILLNTSCRLFQWLRGSAQAAIASIQLSHCAL